MTSINVTDFGTGHCAPVFILSLKRSGSTLLRNIIDSHPEVFASSFWVGQLCQALNFTSYVAVNHLPTGLSESQRQVAALGKTREYVTALLDQYTVAGNARIWCDKTLSNLDYLEIIDKVFNDAKYICLYRNCSDVVQSYLSMCKLGFLPEICSYVSKTPHNLLEAIVEYWTDKNSLILQFERAHPENCYRVNYETLVKSPSETMNGVFRFLGLEWDDALLDKTFSKPVDGFAEGDIKFHFSRQVHTNSVGGGAALPIETVPAPLRTRMQTLLHELGYRSDAASDSPLGDEIGAEGDAVIRVMERFQSVIAAKPDLAQAVGGTCKLVINGRKNGTWFIDPTASVGVVHSDDGIADCSIFLSEETLMAMASGRRSVVQAFENGEVSVSGNVSLATSFGKLLLS